MDKERLQTLYHTQVYQRRVARAFNKKVRPRNLKGDMVSKEIKGLISDPRGKFRPHWAGPYIIKKISSDRATCLVNMDENEFVESTNLDSLNEYYP